MFRKCHAFHFILLFLYQHWTFLYTSHELLHCSKPEHLSFQVPRLPDFHLDTECVYGITLFPERDREHMCAVRSHSATSRPPSAFRYLRHLRLLTRKSRCWFLLSLIFAFPSSYTKTPSKGNTSDFWSKVLASILVPDKKQIAVHLSVLTEKAPKAGRNRPPGYTNARNFLSR